MFFRRPESRAALDTLSAGVAGAATVEVAESVETALLDVGAAEVLAGLDPLPNCPAMKTCAALASFDLVSCLVSAVVPVAGAEADVVVDGDVAVDAGDVVAVNALPATAAAGVLPALVA